MSRTQISPPWAVFIVPTTSVSLKAATELSQYGARLLLSPKPAYPIWRHSPSSPVEVHQTSSPVLITPGCPATQYNRPPATSNALMLRLRSLLMPSSSTCVQSLPSHVWHRHTSPPAPTRWSVAAYRSLSNSARAVIAILPPSPNPPVAIGDQLPEAPVAERQISAPLSEFMVPAYRCPACCSNERTTVLEALPNPLATEGVQLPASPLGLRQTSPPAVPEPFHVPTYRLPP